MRKGSRNQGAEGAGRGEGGQQEAFMGMKPKSTARVWGPGKSHWWTGIRATSRETNTASVPRRRGVDGQGKQILIFWAGTQQHQF